jgi:hypothetical protein
VLFQVRSVYICYCELVQVKSGKFGLFQVMLG